MIIVAYLGVCLFLVGQFTSADYGGYNKGQVHYGRESVYEQDVETLLDIFLQALQVEENIYKETNEKQQMEKMEQFFDSEVAVDEMADLLQAVTRYVGVGYNLLRGSPNGDFDNGGIDPGILSTRTIFDFTYDEGREAFFRGKTVQVPDQVNFQPSSSCTRTSQNRAYSGAKSYQRALDLGVNAGASLSAVRFGLSAAVKRARENTESKRRVNVDRRVVCNLGRVEYLTDARGIHRLSKAFYDRVQELPSSYSAPDYINFIRDWGTHVIVRADVGTTRINRSSLSYNEVYHQIGKQTGGGMQLGANINGYGGSLDLNISVLENSDNRNFRNTSRGKNISIGSEDIPMPISLVFRNISEALNLEYWTVSLQNQNGVTYKSLGIARKQLNLVRALEDYPDYEGAKELKDPLVQINFSWPDGAYALLQATNSRCPQGWSAGSRTQAVGKNTDLSDGITRRIKSKVQTETITLYYCVKNEDSNNLGFEWPEGTYCIAQKGGLCPDGFESGSITWDDRVFFRSNRNKDWGILPEGEYEKSTTQISYCCRSDGDVSSPMLLPINEPFVLYRYYTECQKVNGTQVTEDFIKFDSTSIHNLARNKNNCEGKHPFDEECKGDHKIYFCHYQKEQ